MKNNKKMAFVCDYQSIYGGNFIPSILALAKALEIKGIQVIFIFPFGAKQCSWINHFYDNQFHVCFFNNKQKTFKKAAEIKRHLKQEKVLYVYGHFISPIILRLSIPCFKKMRLFVHLHSDFTSGTKLSFKVRLKIIIEKIINCKSIYISVSEDILNKRHLKRGFYVPNGLCLNRICQSKISREDARNLFGFKETDFVFLIFAWSPFVKGLDIAYKAFFNANKKNNNLKLLVVCGSGNGVEETKEFIEKYTNLSSKTDSVVFTQPIEDVFMFHKASDCFLSSSRSEGFPYSVLEALFYDKRVIVSDIPGTKWSMQYKPLVKVFKTNEADDLADKMIEVFCENERGLDYKVSDSLLEKYGIDNWIESILNIFARYIDL